MMPSDTHSLASSTMDLSIAIVSYNTKGVLLDCIRSIHAHTTNIAFEVIVVDNDSQDGTVTVLKEVYPDMRVIANPDNRGFAKAVNQALAVSHGRHMLLLNSDTLVKDQALTTMVAYLDDHPDVGAVSCKQWAGDGHLNQTCFPFPSIRDHLIYSAPFQRIAPGMQMAAAATQTVDCTKSQDVDWANGACLMVRRSLLQQLGGLDEAFFMYFEDVDLCRRLRQQGCRVRHLAEAEIIHFIGRSSGRDRERLQLEWQFSRIRYIEKHFVWPKRLIMKAWIAGGVLAKLLRIACSDRSDRRQQMEKMRATLWRVWVGQEHCKERAIYSV